LLAESGCGTTMGDSLDLGSRLPEGRHRTTLLPEASDGWRGGTPQRAAPMWDIRQ